MGRSRIVIVALFVLLCGSAARLRAQSGQPHQADAGPSVDAAVGFVAQRSFQANTNQSFWLEGGSFELGARLYKGLGVVGNLTGLHTSSIAASGVPLSLVTVTFGPRYRFHADGKLSVYGQGLVGDANAFNTVIPTMFGIQTSANSLAVQAGGGVDYRVHPHLALRLIDASYVHTQFLNSTNNVQNNLRLGAGLVYRSGK